MSKVTLVHGFWDNNGHRTTDLLTPFFKDKQFEVEEFDYGFTGLLGVRLLNDRRAGELAERTRAETIGVGHSNGCAILQKASFLGAPFSQLVFINPALDADAGVGTQVKRIHVWHSPSDLPVRFANTFISHPWGEMGATGYKGTDPRFINYNKEDDFDVSSQSHLDIFFVKEKLDFFGPLIVNAVVENAG
jgi:hypothetical protein